MKWPKLKHPLLCNVVLVGSVMAPPILFLFLPALPVAAYIHPTLLAVIILSPWIGALWFMISHFALLMMTSTCLEMYHAYLHGRRHFTCPKNGKDPAAIRKRILRRAERFGFPYEVKAVPKELLSLRYKNSPSATVYYNRIEKLLIVYEVEELDKDTLRKLWQSAHAITNIIGREQKPLYHKPKGHSKDNSVSVAAVILANTVSPDVAAELVESKVEMKDRNVLFSAVELSTAKYYFDNQKEPYMFAPPVKNRTVRMIHRTVFGGRPSLRSNPHMLPEPLWLKRDEFHPEDSLWSFMARAQKELKGIGRSEKKRFREMPSDTVTMDDGWLCCKLGERVSTMMVDDDENNPQKKQVILSLNWSYPKSNRISKKDNATIRALTEEFLRGQGFGVTFVDPYDNE